MHRTLAECIRAHASAPAAIIVPTAGAAEALRADARGYRPATRTERAGGAGIRPPHSRRVLFPSARAVPTRRRRCSPPFEREVLLTRAASAASDSGTPAPFRLRPGLIVEMLAFYDELRRRDRTVADLDRLMTDSLQPSVEIDRGAERLFRQTQFLTAAFTRFEDLVGSSGRLDEHALRRLLLVHDGSASYPRVVVSVADQPADPRGLWTADFDFLARLPGLTAIDVVATENVLAAGFHERVHDVLPGIEEERREGAGSLPVLVDAATRRRRRGHALVRQPRPRGGARRARARRRRLMPIAWPSCSSARCRTCTWRVRCSPTPGVPIRRSTRCRSPPNRSPAALDVVFAFVVAAANRASTIDLLSSPHWRFPELEGSLVSVRARVNALDARLRELKYFGGWDRLGGARRACLVCHRRRRRGGHQSQRAPPAARRCGGGASARRSPPPRRCGPARGADGVGTAPARCSTSSGRTSARRKPATPGRRGTSVRARRSSARSSRWPRRTPATTTRRSRSIGWRVRCGAGLKVRRSLRGPDRTACCSSMRPRPRTRMSTKCASWGWSSWTGPSASGAASSIRRRCCRSSAGRTKPIGWRRRARAFTICSACRAGGCRSRPSRSRTMRSCRARRFFRSSRRAGCRSSVPESRSERRRARRSSRHRRSAEADAWLALRAARSSGDRDVYHGAAGPRRAEVYAVSQVERYLACPVQVLRGARAAPRRRAG